MKYVDDTTAVSATCDLLDNSLQSAANALSTWCHTNGMTINVNKTKEMLVYFGLKYPT